MRVLGKLKHGVYVDTHDDCNGMTEADMQLFYGATRMTDRLRGGTGAGHPLDEESDGDSEWEDVDTDDSDSESESENEDTTNVDSDTDSIMEDIYKNVRHKAVRPPKGRCPFTDSSTKKIFFTTLSKVLHNHDAPRGFGLYDDECDGGYPETELIPIGRRRGQRMEVILPVPIWRPRAVVWVQAIRTMEYILANPPQTTDSPSESSSLSDSD
jgi:hypothetical protein